MVGLKQDSCAFEIQETATVLHILYTDMNRRHAHTLPRIPASWRQVTCKRIATGTLNFDVLLTVHLSVILVINQLDAQNLIL